MYFSSDAPVCAESKDLWADPGSQIKAMCRVEASPDTPINFSWVWLTPTYSRRIIPAHVTQIGTRSTVSFTVPKYNSTMQEAARHQLGVLQCWAENKVGRIVNPCTVAIRRPGRYFV